MRYLGITLVMIIMLVSGCMGNGAIVINNVESLSESNSPTTTGGEYPTIENIERNETSIKATLASLAPASNYRIEVTSTEVSGNRIILNSELVETGQIGSSVITKLENRVSVQGSNLDDIEYLELRIESSVNDDNMTEVYLGD